MRRQVRFDAVAERVRAWAAVIAVVVAVGFVPVLLERDSYPLSDYPMFSTRRTAESSFNTAVAVGEGDAVERLSPELIAATDEVIQAGATVSDAIARGQTGALCTDIAARVSDGGPEGAIAVEVVTERFDAVAWYAGDRQPLGRVVHARCPVP
jgi:hypothetical protein